MIGLSVIDGVGFGAAGLVLATFCMRSMSALRWVAIASNVAFIAYGYLGGLAPVLLLHALLLPVNICRLAQLRNAHLRSSPTEERKKGGRDSERHYPERSSGEDGARVQLPAGIGEDFQRSTPEPYRRCAAQQHPLLHLLPTMSGIAPPRSRDPDRPACSARSVTRRFHVD
jgi:hypothetical protein